MVFILSLKWLKINFGAYVHVIKGTCHRKRAQRRVYTVYVFLAYLVMVIKLNMASLNIF